MLKVEFRQDLKRDWWKLVLWDEYSSSWIGHDKSKSWGRWMNVRVEQKSWIQRAVEIVGVLAKRLTWQVEKQGDCTWSVQKNLCEWTKNSDKRTKNFVIIITKRGRDEIVTRLMVPIWDINNRVVGWWTKSVRGRFSCSLLRQNIALLASKGNSCCIWRSSAHVVRKQTDDEYWYW